MKTIGIIGGMSWHSTALYYRLINEETHRRLGGCHSARILLDSLDFAEIEPLQQANDWSPIGTRLAHSARALERSGAEGIIIACNTVHRVFDHVVDAVNVPLIHIADALGNKLRKECVATVGILGTLHTMRGDFLGRRLQESFRIEPRLPSEKDQDWLHRVIYSELAQGAAKPASQERLTGITEGLKCGGADAIALACTELSLIANPKSIPLPSFDTAEIHAMAAVDWAFK